MIRSVQCKLVRTIRRRERDVRAGDGQSKRQWCKTAMKCHFESILKTLRIAPQVVPTVENVQYNIMNVFTRRKVAGQATYSRFSPSATRNRAHALPLGTAGKTRKNDIIMSLHTCN